MRRRDTRQARREEHDEMMIADILFLVAVVIYLFGEDMARRSRA
jgi:hypothetical protein